MKVISYSLFQGNAEAWERMAYVRGFYFNCRMNNFIYPDWRTHLEVDRSTYNDFKKLFDWLVENNTLDLHVNDNTPVLCEGMMWRMKPIFTIDISHVLCRDCDSITTYREALAIQEWLETDYAVHALHDNPAHSGLMGGMVGFNSAKIKAIMGWNFWEDAVSGYNLSERGSDQHLLNQKVLPAVQSSELLLRGNKGGMQLNSIEFNGPLPQVASRFWESNLTCRHIGSAGIVEMETLRFFKRFDEYNWKFMVIEEQYPDIFYWHKYGKYNWHQ